MSRERKEVEAALEKKGFLRNEGDHHRFIYHTKDGRKTRVLTKTSHSHRQIADNILSQMTKQCGLSNKQFGLLVECPLSREDYEQELIEAGLVASVSS
jgi:predicted RNA binding protein YcfA (HicA-like mRNA interferase family)